MLEDNGRKIDLSHYYMIQPFHDVQPIRYPVYNGLFLRIQVAIWLNMRRFINKEMDIIQQAETLRRIENPR